MINSEPLISVGIYEHESESRVCFNGPFQGPDGAILQGDHLVRMEGRELILSDASSQRLARGCELSFRAAGGSTFTLRDVTIGIHFHWERKEDQTFEGSLRLVANADGTITAINDVSVALYLKSVISSEMSAEAPMELLRAHAITSRSWENWARSSARIT